MCGFFCLFCLWYEGHCKILYNFILLFPCLHNLFLVLVKCLSYVYILYFTPPEIWKNLKKTYILSVCVHTHTPLSCIISSTTNNYFFSWMWRKMSFVNITVTKYYTMHSFHTSCNLMLAIELALVGQMSWAIPSNCSYFKSQNVIKQNK